VRASGRDTLIMAFEEDCQIHSSHSHSLTINHKQSLTITLTSTLYHIIPLLIPFHRDILYFMLGACLCDSTTLNNYLPPLMNYIM